MAGDIQKVVRVISVMLNQDDDVELVVNMRGPISLHFNRISEKNHLNEAMISGSGFTVQENLDVEWSP